MSKTLIEKLAAAEAVVAKLKEAIASAAILNDIQINDKVTIKYGRAETARQIEGSVVGIKSDDKGTTVAILSEDFKPYTVAARDIVTNHTKVERDADTAGDVVPTDAISTQDNAAAADPLAAE